MSAQKIIFQPRGIYAKPPPASIIPVEPSPIASSDAVKLLPASVQARYAKPQKRFIPSPQQAAFFDWVETGSGNCILEAVAGAGKSTTLLRASALMKGLTFLGAYGKDAAKDLKAKARENGLERPSMNIGTMHGAGFYDWARINKAVQVKDDKVRKIFRAMLDDNAALKARMDRCGPFVGKMVSFAKQFLLGVGSRPGIDNMAVLLKLMDHFTADQDLPDEMRPEEALEVVQEVFRRSHAACREIIDFDDMLYAPLAYDIRIFGNDWVLGDEWQDANPARRELAKRLLKSGGRAVFCGDKRQAIFGFTGAGSDSLERTAKEFNCQRMPLTVTYRCPKTVVAYVKPWMPEIEAHPSAPEGVVRAVKFERANAPAPMRPWFQQEDVGPTDAILCRYSRPLIQTAYAMIKEGIACKVEGRDIGNGLIALCRLWRISTLDRLEERLKGYRDREISKAIAAESERRRQEIEDKLDTLAIFIARCRALGKTRIDDLVVEIEALFADNVEGVVRLSTGHKAKGREWPRVYWIQCAQRGRPSKEWEFEQESNLKGVIGTRAMAELVLVPEGAAETK